MRKSFTIAFTFLLFSAAGASAAAPIGESDKADVTKSGDDLLNQDRLKEAIASYTKAVHSHPKNSVAHQRLGHAYALDHKLEEAEGELRTAVSLNPANETAHFDLGWVYGLRRAYSLAVVEERAALAINPLHAPAYVNLGIALTRLADFDSAAAAFKRAIELEPQNVDDYINMAGLQARRGDYKAAVEYYRRAVALDHNDANAHIGLAAALGKLGDLKGQITELGKAASLDPDDATVHGKLGWALYQSGDWQGAALEGTAANGLRAQQSSSKFLGTMLTVWAALFLVFGIIFGAVFFGSRFKPQHDETLIRSFFLVFYRDRPGRFVITNRRLVFVPEAFSQWFGATRMSIEHVDVESFYSQSSVTGGRLAVLCTNGTVVHFMMPVLVLEPAVAELEKLQFGSRDVEPLPDSSSFTAGTAEHAAMEEHGDKPMAKSEQEGLFEAPSFDPEASDWVEVVSSATDLRPAVSKDAQQEPLATDNGHTAETVS